MMPGGSGGEVNTTLPMILSIVATLFCCLPGGIVGIVFAAQAGTALTAGDYAEAKQKAKSSMTAALISMGCGIAMYIFFIVMSVIGAMSER